ncbi:MAG: hypothetical protein AB7G11_03615 [Phycisphaerales bacterium]
MIRNKKINPKPRCASDRRARHERGTVLLMIVGVLALIAIIAVVYAAIAQADRRGADAFAKANQLDEHVDQFRDYIAAVIGDGRLDTYVDPIPGGNNIGRLSRKAWDAPSVDPRMATLVDAAHPVPFSTTGGAYSPWLSSIEPTRLTSTALIDPLKPYLNARDWFSITNICPDGRFVNLANLRNNFRAEPGYGIDARGRRRMSEGLTLFDQQGRPYSTSSGTVLLPDGSPASPFVPAHWTMRQINAFRPIRDVARGPNSIGPKENEYYPNQWADADGDGIGDSRWFEMSRLDPLSPLNNPFVEALLPQDPSIRWIYACKIIDLSGMVNLNTATDQYTDPRYDSTYPDRPFKIGLSPGDVDLRGLLSMASVYNRYIEGASGIGYDRIEQPPAPPVNNPMNYGPASGQRYNEPAARAIGYSAYGSLRTAIGTGVIPKPAPQPPPAGVDWTVPEVVIAGGYTNTMPPPPVTARRAWYEQVGLNPDGGFVALNTTTTGVQAFGPLGIENELDLRAFGGANDFSRRSDVEAILDGRSTKPPYTLPWYGPLRSNRDDLLERANKGAGRTDGLASDAAMLLAFANVRNHVTAISGGSPISSLTPMSLPQADPDRLDERELKVDVTKVLKLPRTSTGGAEERMNDLDRVAYVQHLADALMPYRFDPINQNPTLNSWGSSRASGPYWKRAVNYGYGAEFAYRSLIHLALNTWDALDSDNDADSDIAGPTAASVRLTTTLLGDRAFLPWPELSLPNPQLAQDVSALQGTDQYNAFGIEAQPFLVQVATYAIYTDMPPTRVTGGPIGGDDEWNDRMQGPNPGDPIVYAEITIDLARQSGNPDYIGEVIAFQVTNPFDRRIVLDGGANQPGMLYYAEYAGKAYRLGEFDDTTRQFSMRTTLEPGESKVFYCLSRPRSEMEDRIRIARNRPGNPGMAFDLDTFLDAQLGVGQHIETTMVNPKSGLPVDLPMSGSVIGVLDIHNENQAPRFELQDNLSAWTTDLRNAVMLWRVLRAATDSSEVYPFNNPRNDLMVDRMRDPAGNSGGDLTLYFNFSGIAGQVGGSEGGDDLSADPRDNTGLSAIFWGSIRRPNDVANTADRAPVGTMPPWCIEARYDQAYPLGAGPVWYNKDEDTDRSLGAVGDYGGSGQSQPRFRTVDNLTSVLSNSMAASLPQELRLSPQNKTGNDIPRSQSTLAGSNSGLPYGRTAVQISLGGFDLDGKPRNPGLFSRVGDLLLPLAIGPFQEPKIGLNGENTFQRLEKQWMALSEVLAICSDYYSPPQWVDTPNGRKESLYYTACHLIPNPQGPPLLDRGHLVLDAFVPYLDRNNNGFFDYDLNNSGNGDRTIGLGVPLAFNVLDRFRVNSYGSITKVAPGTINPNTAPLACLDALSPLMAPDPEATTLPSVPWMHAMDNAATPPRRRLFDPTQEAWDVSSTVAAYRDLANLPIRPIGTAASNLFADFGITTSGNMFDNFPRRRTTYIHGLREESGFRSAGEILAARLRKPNGEIYDRKDNNGIDRLGVNPTMPMTAVMPLQGHPGVTSTTVTYDRNANGIIDVGDAPFVPANIEQIDTYDGKIAIANSILASINVHSDIFCAWFLVHGYTQSDVENLSDLDPLTPSIAKRYVMIVDRSNVLRRGDKPRILLFKEVPL